MGVWKNADCAKNYAKVIFLFILIELWGAEDHFEATQEGRTVLPTMLCAAEKQKDSCQGDSGGIWPSLKLPYGPLNMKSELYWWYFSLYLKGPLNCFNSETESWELCGIVSWGAECADPGRKKYYFSKVFHFFASTQNCPESTHVWQNFFRGYRRMFKKPGRATTLVIVPVVVILLLY